MSIPMLKSEIMEEYQETPDSAKQLVVYIKGQ